MTSWTRSPTDRADEQTCSSTVSRTCDAREEGKSADATSTPRCRTSTNQGTLSGVPARASVDSRRRRRISRCQTRKMRRAHALARALRPHMRIPVPTYPATQTDRRTRWFHRAGTRSSRKTRCRTLRRRCYRAGYGGSSCLRLRHKPFRAMLDDTQHVRRSRKRMSPHRRCERRRSGNNSRSASHAKAATPFRESVVAASG